MQRARIALFILLACIWGTLGVVRDVTDFLRARDWLEWVIITGATGVGVLTLLLARNANKRALLIVVAMGAAVFTIAWHSMRSPEERVHLIEYGAVALLFEASFPRRLWLALLCTAAAGWCDELIQALLPSRHYDLRDVFFNALAGALSLSLLAVYRRLAY